MSILRFLGSGVSKPQCYLFFFLATLFPVSASAFWVNIPPSVSIQYSSLSVISSGVSSFIDLSFITVDSVLVPDATGVVTVQPLFSVAALPVPPFGYIPDPNVTVPVDPALIIDPVPAIDWMSVALVFGSIFSFYLFSFGLGLVISLFRSGA